jgi:hypothetical protein
MRAELRILHGTPRLSTIKAASANLERCWENLCSARDAFTNCTPGDTDALFRSRDSWVAAIGAYESARLALRTAVAERDGRRLLRVVGGRQ